MVVDAVVVLVLGSACQWIYGASVMLITSSAVQTAELCSQVSRLGGLAVLLVCYDASTRIFGP